MNGLMEKFCCQYQALRMKEGRNAVISGRAVRNYESEFLPYPSSHQKPNFKINFIINYTLIVKTTTPVA
jgi:hypothetical protein